MPPPGRSAPRSTPLWRVAGGAHPSAPLVRGRTQVTLLWEFRSHFQSPFWLLLRLALLLLPVLAAHPAHAVTAAQLTTAVDVYMSMESGLGGNTVTTNLLNAATHGQGGWWSLFPDTVSELTVSTSYEQPLGGSVTVGNTAYKDIGAFRSLACQNSNTRQFARFTFDTEQPKVSVGCFLRLGNFTGSTFGSYDIITMEGDGEFAVMNFQDFPGAEFIWEIHTQAGVGGAVPVVPNKTYWVTMLWDQPNLLARLQVYDPVNWALLGSSQLVLESHLCQTVCLGRYDDHPDTSPAYHYYDDLIIDVTSAKFPLLPGHIPVDLAPLALSATGLGKVSGPTNESLLVLGRGYTLTAYPAAGQLFNGWSGSSSTVSRTLRFLMASNFTATASFVTNLFPSVKGTYNGLFRDTGNPDQRSSGYASLRIGDFGTYSGRLLLNGRTYSLSGTLTPDGAGMKQILRHGTNSLVATLALDLTNGTDQLTGTVAEVSPESTVWSADLVLDRLLFNRTLPASLAGRYTLLVLPEEGAAEGPQGDGIGTVMVSGTGGILFAGTLADGTRLRQATTLSKQGTWPLYASLYSGKGSLWGLTTFDTNAVDTDLTGALAWYKQGQPKARYSPGGFTNSVSLVGSVYRAPNATNLALNLTNASLAFTNLQMGFAFTNRILLNPAGTIVNQSSNKVSLSLSRTTGLFSGSVTPPASPGGKAWTFSGALLQKPVLGGGFLLGTNQSGPVTLSP